MNYKNILAITLLIGVLGVFSLVLQRPWDAVGSVAVGNEYLSTTTPTVADLTNLCPARAGMASSTTGVLSGVDITNYGTGSLQIYDATTSAITLRSADQATSTLLLWGMINGMATSSHPDLDIEFKRGLFIDTSGTVGTSTITYRCVG